MSHYHTLRHAALASRLAGLLAVFSLGWALPVAADDMEPSANVNGTLGLGQAVSAEAMGQDRLTVTARGNLYPQQKDYPGAPLKNAQITTGTAAIAFGVNPYIDAFASLAGYNLSGSAPDNGAGVGTVTGGFQGSLPFPEKIPGRFGFQVAALAGLAGNQINTNFPDGYNYLETRTGNDFSIKLTQTVIFNQLGLALRLHLNEGIITSLEDNKTALLTQGAAIEFNPTPSFILGAEFHSRSVLKNAQNSDPMWFTPSVEFRSANHLNVQFGGEMSLSQERDGGTTRALEPWRLFAAVTWSMDLMAGKRREALEKARLDSLSRLALEAQARRSQELADSLARKAREDSLMRAGEANAARKLADSLAAKAKLDSIALADANRRLLDEQSHRSDWEKEFLKTGVLNMEALYFETGRAVISINSKPYLNLVGKMLSKYPKLQMEIGGHTDNVGGAAANLKLSQDRADAVRLYMTAAYTELNGHLTARGYGLTQPKASNKTADGRQINRRVEITVLNKDALQEYK